MTNGYLVPTTQTEIEIVVRRSRFIGLSAPAPTVAAARAFIDKVRHEYADASHHVYAFEVGHGDSVTHGMSDDGEPSGTAGRPALTVVSHHELGDVVVVIVRYFGGSKLGTGGLVRAYTQATQQVLAATVSRRKVATGDLLIRLPYECYDVGRMMINKLATIEVVEETFAQDTCLHLRGPVKDLAHLRGCLAEVTSGRLIVEEIPPPE